MREKQGRKVRCAVRHRAGNTRNLGLPAKIATLLSLPPCDGLEHLSLLKKAVNGSRYFAGSRRKLNRRQEEHDQSLSELDCWVSQCLDRQASPMGPLQLQRNLLYTGGWPLHSKCSTRVGPIRWCPACLVGIEACPSAHHWSRQLQALGHTVRLMPPSYVKAYLKRSKNDANDAAARANNARSVAAG
jgi:hypothetical protein